MQRTTEHTFSYKLFAGTRYEVSGNWGREIDTRSGVEIYKTAQHWYEKIPQLILEGSEERVIKYTRSVYKLLGGLHHFYPGQTPADKLLATLEPSFAASRSKLHKVLERKVSMTEKLEEQIDKIATLSLAKNIAENETACLWNLDRCIHANTWHTNALVQFKKIYEAQFEEEMNAAKEKYKKELTQYIASALQSKMITHEQQAQLDNLQNNLIADHDFLERINRGASPHQKEETLQSFNQDNEKLAQVIANIIRFSPNIPSYGRFYGLAAHQQQFSSAAEEKKIGLRRNH